MRNSLTSLLILLGCWATGPLAEEAYIRPLAPGWTVTPIISVGEKAANGYAMVGSPDGLAAEANGDGTLRVLMNHEIEGSEGSMRAHGGSGAFVSDWTVRLSDLAVLKGEDLVRRVHLWTLGTYWQHPLVTFSRLCSADMAPVSAFFDAATGLGYNGRLLLNGEEEKDAGGRAFAHAVRGTEAGSSYELPHLGRVAWENLLALPGAGRRTVVIGLDDYPGGHVYVYVGEKRRRGNPVERAGLVGGALYALRLDRERFTLVALGEADGLDGTALRARALKLGATPLARPEDGAWDPSVRNRFWFATTDRIDGLSQLFRLDFDDARRPERGGRIVAALTAKDIGGQMFDNLAADGDGRVLIDEDPGKSAFPSGIWLYDPKRPGGATRLFEAVRERFVDEVDQRFMTLDDEQSGIVEVTELVRSASWFDPARRYYLGTTQAHAEHPEAALVEYGQLYLISGPRAGR